MNAGQFAAKMPLDSRGRYALVSLVLVVLLFVSVLLIVCANPLMVAPEVALNLECAKLIVAGKVPYVDFFSLAPPLTLYSTLAPLLISQALGLPSSLASNIVGLAISLASVLTCASILLPRRHHREWHCFPLFIVGLAIANVLMLFQIGQVEYLAMFALMPYFLVRWLVWNGHLVSRKVAIASGLCAALAFCLWYGSLGFTGSLELFWLLSLRQFRPLLALEVRTAIGALVIFLLLQLLLPESARVSYLAQINPLLFLGYQCHDWSIYGTGSVPERRDIFYAAIAATLFALPYRRRTSLAQPLIVVFLSGFALYLSQMKGLTSSAIPMIFATTLLLTIDFGILSSLVHRLRLVARNAMVYRIVLAVYTVGVCCCLFKAARK